MLFCSLTIITGQTNIYLFLSTRIQIGIPNTDQDPEGRQIGIQNTG